MDEHVVLTLVTIAGVGATFAGFSGVVAVFDRRAHGEWYPEELFRLTNMLVMSLGACLVSLVPMLEEFFGIHEATQWTGASLILGAFCLVYWSIANRLRRGVTQARPGLLSPWAQVVVNACLVGAILLQALNVAEVLVVRGAGSFVAGLWLLLIAAGLQFAFLVLIPLSPGGGDDPADDPAP